jgi:hypothetical protein
MRFTSIIAVSCLSLTLPAGPRDLPRGDAAPAPISIESTSPGWTRRVEWGLGRFRAAGLTLPPMTISVHDDMAPCDGSSGLFRPHDPIEVHLCSPSAVESRAARLITLHELAHAWAETQLTAEDRAVFLRLRGLEAWTDRRLPRHEWGAEHVAEVVSWGLMDEPIRIIRIYDAQPAQLSVAFDLLVGGPPLWNER